MGMGGLVILNIFEATNQMEVLLQWGNLKNAVWKIQ